MAVALLVILVALGLLVLLTWTLAARLFTTLDEHYPDVASELGPWNQTLMQITGSARITAFLWSRRAMALDRARALVIAIRVLSSVYLIGFAALLAGFLRVVLDAPSP